MNWNQSDAIQLCRAIEYSAPFHGCHVALTGSLLYGETLDDKKDCDIILYRIRGQDWDLPGLFEVLESGGLQRTDENKNPWCHKFVSQNGRKIDFLIPEAPEASDAYYPSEQNEDTSS